MELVLYVHGRGGCPEEAAHYRPLFPNARVEGLEYRADTPWDAGRELRPAVEKRAEGFSRVTLIAVSIGAFFSMHAGLDDMICRAYFISPIVDMEKLIRSLMSRAGVTEDELRRRGTIPTSFGEMLSWEYLRWVREHPVRWNAPTRILWGRRDELTAYETVAAFAASHGADLTVMENGEHWFHTEEQMRFLDEWIRGGGALT